MTTFNESSRVRGQQLVGQRQTHAQWSNTNPILAEGQIAFSTDNRQFKVGDGVRRWGVLDYFGYEPTINESVADQVANAADTYLTGSGLLIPAYGLQTRATLRWLMAITKTAAGIATPTWRVRVGAAGAVADTARLTFVGPAQTAAVDTALVEITAVVRVNGALTVLSGALRLTHNLDVTGFAIASTPVIAATSAAFTTVPTGLQIGVSIDPGAAGVWTHTMVLAELIDT